MLPLRITQYVGVHLVVLPCSPTPSPISQRLPCVCCRRRSPLTVYPISNCPPHISPLAGATTFALRVLSRHETTSCSSWLGAELGSTALAMLRFAGFFGLESSQLPKLEVAGSKPVVRSLSDRSGCRSSHGCCPGSCASATWPGRSTRRRRAP
jgi:hypothetical protein